MSGVLRRGSLNFDFQRKRGSAECNLYGGYDVAQCKGQRTPEISIISWDFRRNADDLKKDLQNDPYTNNSNNNSNGIGNANKNNITPSTDTDKSDIISDYIGDCGLWNTLWVMFLSLFQIPTTFQVFIFVFQAAEKDFWCSRPQHFSDMDVSVWRNLTQTSDSCFQLNINYDNITNLLDYIVDLPKPWNYTECHKFEFSNADNGGVDFDGDGVGDVVGGGWFSGISEFFNSNGLIFGNDGAARTIIEEFTLVCKRSHILSVVEMCFLVGAAIGSVSSGWLSDRFGRKHTLMSFAFVQCLFGTILAFSTSLAMYMALRIIIGFASMTVAVVSFVLIVELVSGKWRTIIGILCLIPVAITYVLTAGIAYYIRDWRILQLTISLPWFAFLTIWYCVPESPRWLLARGKLTQLYVIVERAARTNGITLPINYKKSLEAVAPSPTTPASLSASTVLTKIDTENPLLVVFGKKYWRTTCLNLLVWLTLIIIYFGLTLHISNLGGNIYMNTAIVGAVEALSIFFSVFVVLKLGIRRNLIAYMLIPGLCCLSTNLVPKGDDYMIYVIGLAMIAKCVIGANNAIIPTYTAMQYPTVVRNFGVGLSNLAAGIALILVPYMWLLEHIDPLLPMSIMGMCGIIGAIALTLMKDVEQ